MKVALRLSGLWRQPDFLKLWAGQTVSLLGSAITGLAIPLIAVSTLSATPTEMGILRAIQNLPWIFFGLVAGVWVDRLRRRPILIWADLGRAILLSLIPVAASLHVLSMNYLVVISFVIGSLTVFFEVAHPSLLPSLVGRDQLVDGNSKLQISQSVVQIAGPSLAGLLVQWLTAPIAIFVDALSFLMSALFLSLINKAETLPSVTKQTQSVFSDVVEGLRFLLSNPLLRSLVTFAATAALFDTAISALYVLFAVREVNVAPALVGLIWATSGPSALMGAAYASRVAERIGLGRTIVWTALGLGVANLLIALASGPKVVAISLLIVSQVLVGFLNPIYMINQRSLRQAITPDRLQGRVNAAFRFIAFGIMPIGALMGGILGELIGLRTTIAMASFGTMLAFLWIHFSPLNGASAKSLLE